MSDIVINRVTHIEFPDNPEIDIHDIKIESGSLLLEEILCDSNIIFGETNATRFEATIYNLEDVAGLKIKVYTTDIDGNNRKNLFEGYVDSCKQDRDGHYRKLVAYDAIYSIGKANVAGWWLRFWEARETATLKELRESLCTWVGIRYDNSVNLHNDGFVCTKTSNLSSVSFGTMLFWIGEIQCAQPHIDRDGMLRFISLIAPHTKDISNDYERATSEFEGFITAPYDTVELYDYNNNLMATTNSTGAVESKNIYAIKDNALLFGLETDGIINSANEFVHNYLTQIQQIRYTPCTLNMIVSDLDLVLGDYITVGTVSSIVLQNTLSGILLVEQEIRAAGSEYLHDDDTTPSAQFLSLQRRTDELKDEIITDDLLNYSHTNTEAYTIAEAITPIISVAIDMPKSSNLVFLATVNLESISTEYRDVEETVILNGEEVKMIRREKVPVVVETYFEWNGAEILSNKPTETYSEDGKHLLNLMFFSIGGRQAGNVITFKVFITAKHGRIHIAENQVNATIISKGSSAGNLPWDGTITVDETINPIVVDNFATGVGYISDAVTTDTNTPTPSVATDTIGLITPEFGTISITGVDDTVDPSIK